MTEGGEGLGGDSFFHDSGIVEIISKSIEVLKTACRMWVLSDECDRGSF